MFDLCLTYVIDSAALLGLFSAINSKMAGHA